MGRLKPSDLRVFEADVDGIDHPPPLPGVATSGAGSCIVGRHGVDLAQLLPDLVPDRHYHIPSKANWSLHEMLGYILRHTGPAKVWITSWGITQEPLQKVMDMQRAGLITEINALFDGRVKLQCPDAYQLMLAGTARVRLTKNHSKVIVVRNAQWGVTVITSANLTQNVRLEYYVICTHATIADWNSSWIGLEMDGAQPFDPE